MTDAHIFAVTMTTGATSPIRISAEKLADQRLQSAVEGVYDVLKKAGDATLNGGDKRNFEKLTRRSETLTESLLSNEQTQILASLSEGSAVTIEAALTEHEIPWELLRINGQFLCERFACGRIVSDLQHAQLHDSARTSLTSRRANVLIADSRDLVSTNSEKTIVERRLRQISHDTPNLIQVADSHHNPLTRNIVLEVLQRSSWLHFAGHARAVEEQRVLCVSEQQNETDDDDTTEQLTPNDLQSLNNSPEVVFLNACGALRHSRSSDPNRQQSFVGELLRLGSQWLIGPVVPMLDSQTRHFVTEFYDAMVAGCSMGEAVCRARVEARRKLGQYNLLTLTYVLYGNPSASPFSMRNAMSTKSMSTNAANNKPSAAPVTFPCACSTCGKLVETRHGLANEPAVLLGEPALCRTCHRSRRTDVPRELRPAVVDSWRSDTKPSPTQPGPTKPSPTRPVVPASVRVRTEVPARTPAERSFLEHLEECVARDVKWLDLKTGITVTAQAKPAEMKSPVGSNLYELDQPSTPANYELRKYDLCSPRGTQIAKLIFVLLPESADSVSSRFLTELLPQVGIRSGSIQDEMHHYCFVCSHQGFDSDVVNQLQLQPAPVWYSPNVSLYLHDVTKRHTSFREADLAAYNLSDLLQRAGTTQQFQQAVEWLRLQLPLVTSVSSCNIVDELQLETDAVETAMRCVAVQQNLKLETTAEFGLVLSEPELKSISAHPSESGRRWHQWFLNAISDAICHSIATLRSLVRWMRE